MYFTISNNNTLSLLNISRSSVMWSLWPSYSPWKLFDMFLNSLNHCSLSTLWKLLFLFFWLLVKTIHCWALDQWVYWTLAQYWFHRQESTLCKCKSGCAQPRSYSSLETAVSGNLGIWESGNLVLWFNL